MSPFPFPWPPGDSWANPGTLTCASAGPVLGAHKAPHGVISGVAVLPVEAVPASCGHSPQPQDLVPRRPSSYPAASAPDTHLPERVAIAGCPWIPSGSSCKGSGWSAWSWSGGRAGAAGSSSREIGVIPPVAGHAPAARGRQRTGPRRTRPAGRAAVSPGRWRSRGGEGRRGAVWSVENPHGPPRAGPAVTSAPAARRGGVFARAQDPPGMRSGAWGVKSTLEGAWGRSTGVVQAGVEGRGRHQSGVASFLPRPDLTSCSSGCAVTEGMGTPNPSPTLSLASFHYLLGAGEGVNAAPRSFCPTCAPCLFLRLAGSLAVPAATRSRRGELSWDGGGGTDARRLSAPLCHLLLLESGPLADCHLPAQGTKNASTGTGYRWPTGQCPGLAQDQRCPNPRAASCLAGPYPEPAPPRPDGSPFPCGRPPLRPAGTVQCRLRASERGQGGGWCAPAGDQAARGPGTTDGGALVAAGGCRPYPAGLPSLQVTDVLSRRCRRRSSLSCCAEQGYRDCARLLTCAMKLSMLPSTAVKSRGKLSTGCPAAGAASARGGGGGGGGCWPRRRQVFLPSPPPAQCRRPSSRSTRTPRPMAAPLGPAATCGEQAALRRRGGEGARPGAPGPRRACSLAPLPALGLAEEARAAWRRGSRGRAPSAWAAGTPRAAGRGQRRVWVRWLWPAPMSGGGRAWA